MFSISKRAAIVSVAAVAALAIATTTASAGTTATAAPAAAASTPAPPPVRIACNQGGTRALIDAYENIPANFKCPAGDFAVSGLQGPKGDTGATGPAGKQGPSGVQAVATVTGSATLAAIGGSWSAGHVDAKDVTLPAGTYLITVTGDFYRAAASTATPVLQIQLNGGSQQLTGYTGAFPYDAAEAVGAVAGVPNGLEQTAVAEGIITLTATTTLSADAFGYNPDRGGEGGGDFGVNATVSYVQLTPAS